MNEETAPAHRAPAMHPVEAIAAAVTGISATQPPPGARIFSLSDRLGRVRYLVYAMLAGLGAVTLLLAIYLAASHLPAALGYLVSRIAAICVINALLPVAFIVLSIRRLHDINASGWWSPLVLIPFAGLVLAFIPGSKEENRFGPVPPANNPALSVTVVALPVLLIAFFVGYKGNRQDARPQEAKGGIQSYRPSTGAAEKAPVKPLKRYYEP